MRLTLRLIAVLLIILGAIWVLQGVNILPGSFMTGQIQWAYRGALAAVIGLGILLYSSRLR